MNNFRPTVAVLLTMCYANAKVLAKDAFEMAMPCAIGLSLHPFTGPIGASKPLFVTAVLCEVWDRRSFSVNVHPLVYCIRARFFCGTLESVLVSLLNAVTPYGFAKSEFSYDSTHLMRLEWFSKAAFSECCLKKICDQLLHLEQSWSQNDVNSLSMQKIVFTK